MTCTTSWTSCWALSKRILPGRLHLGVNSGGKKVIEHHKALAKKLFIVDPSGKWDEKSDIKKLANIMKN
jgi:hypothetical protein